MRERLNSNNRRIGDRMKIGFTIGKFAPLHKGHQYLIEKGLKEMDQFYVIIYETKVTKVPIETRANWIKQIYPTITLIYAKNPPSQYGLDEQSVKIQMDYLKELVKGIKMTHFYNSEPYGTFVARDLLVKGIKMTHFYNSEPYGKFVARDLKIQEVQVDRKRRKYPISGTAIRKEIEKNENYIEQIVYQDMKEA